ncbi:MAG: hypothetical protein ABSG16_21610 [Candidatus Acidiferrum sp.]|jgi:hypothetical protein
MNITLRYPIWQKFYLAAMLEMDSRKMKVKIADAISRIHRRMICTPAQPEERLAVGTALNSLKFCQRCACPVPS